MTKRRKVIDLGIVHAGPDNELSLPDTPPIEQGNPEVSAQKDTPFSIVVPTSALSKGIPTYLGSSAKILNGSEVYLIAVALRVAAETYKQDAIAATVRHSLMLAEQFEQQASRTLAMAEYLEMCDQVEVKSGKL